MSLAHKLAFLAPLLALFAWTPAEAACPAGGPTNCKTLLAALTNADVNAALGATITLSSGITFTVSNTLTFAGTNGTTMTFPGTSATIARTDADNSFTGTQTLLGHLVGASLATTGTISGSLCQDVSGNFIFSSGGNCYAGGGSPGGATDSIQYNTGGSFGGISIGTSGRLLLDQGAAASALFEAMSGDATLAANGTITVTKTNGTAFGALATVTPGSGVATALGDNVGSAGSILVNGGALGTPTSGTGTNITGIPAANILAGALASGMTATTQSPGDNSTKLATTAYVPANSVQSVGTGACLTGGPITATGTIAGTELLGNNGAYITGSTYQVAAADNCLEDVYKGTGATAWTIAQAGTTGFTAGFGTEIVNESAAGTITLTATTSTFSNGINTLVITPGEQCNIFSDGTNYPNGACTAVAPFGAGTVTSASGAQGISVTSATTTPVIGNTATSQSNTTVGAATLTAANILNGELERSGSVAAYTDTLPTAANIVAGYTGAVVNRSFILFYHNTVAFAVTLAGNTGTAIVGATTCAPLSICEFIGTLNNVTGGSEAVTIYGLGLANSAVGAYTVLSNSTAASAPMVPVSSPTVNRLALSQSTTTANLDSFAGCQASSNHCVGISSNSVFVGEWDKNSHYASLQAIAPGISACGSTPNGSVDANATDFSGTITFGGTASTCTLTFHVAYGTWDHCRVTFPSILTAETYAYTKSTITITATALTGTADYECDGQ